MNRVPARDRNCRRLGGVTVVLALIVLGVACGSSPGDDEGNPSAGHGDDAVTVTSQDPSGGLDGEPAGIVRDPPLVVAGLSLPEVDADGVIGSFELTAEPGGLLLVYFGFTTCPDVCPTTMADVRVALGELGSAADPLEVAVITVDPDTDTPEMLHGYVEFFAGDHGHALRTEDLDELAEVEGAFLATSSRTPREGGEGNDVEHTTSLYVVDDADTVVLEWPFGVPASQFVSDLTILLDRV